jgi:transposase
MDNRQVKRKYTREFKESAVRLVNVEKTPVAQAAADLGMPINTLTAWLHQARRGKGTFTPQGGVDWEKKARELEAENRRLKLERDILKKATAFFVKEGAQP